MNIVNRIKSIACSLINYPYIPEEFLTQVKGPVLMHISDTPADIYPYIFRIVNKINPQYIIHTGDMVDDIKLEFLKGLKDEYFKSVRKLITKLEESDAIIYYALGNHDDFNIVSKLSQRGNILTKGDIKIENLSFHINHYHENNNGKKDYYLFGHSFTPAHYKGAEHIGLNGLLNINLIDLTTKKVYQLNYPIGTNRLRRMEMGRIGI
ncbi:metallophosphoesterase family protein [Alkaliphilus peptidifermentans]|uniref:Calcineurin-like phosphoesterase n=1 Tax=Alkaliphilus peptidifermentans DSM 18978 TaxID=1120976 RepID=A0A1G5FKP9_9FIRM|nr:metallophosphoesterase [Alkaliphilus peptidifermentans]SCY39836.1 Calcineurin-like phosphoesterase [Alkaliphilus peptidifermentans DSM 18978]